MTLDQALDHLADMLGITVRDDTTGKLHGHPAGWFPHTRTILTRPGLGPTNRRCNLAHELAHAVHGDPPGHHPRAERRAWETAAQWLIHPTEYADAEKCYGPHPGALAAELGVTRHLIEVWQTMTTRHRENQLT